MSADPVGRQKEFDEQNELNFPLLSDTNKVAAKVFGVKRMGPLPTKRATFVVDRQRRLLGEVRSETNMEKHADEALAILRARTTD